MNTLSAFKSTEGSMNQCSTKSRALQTAYCCYHYEDRSLQISGRCICMPFIWRKLPIWPKNEVLYSIGKLQ